MSSPYETPGIKEEPNPESEKEMRNSRILLSLVVVTVVGSLLYRFLRVGHLEQSSLMFIGLPTFLAFVLATVPAGKSVTGRILKGTTFFLLLLGILAVEGVICIAMAAPLFWLVGIIIGLSCDSYRKRRSKRSQQLRCSVLIVLGVMSLEGVTDWLSFDREESVTRALVTDLSREEVLEAMSRGPELVGITPPAFLTLGFPQVQEIEGGGVDIGSEWRIHFAGGEGLPGDLTAELVERDNTSLRYECTGDTSHIAHWLDWKSATWTIEETETGGSTVKLEIEYVRLLDPAWYFKPLERYAVGEAAEFFLEQTFSTSGDGTVD